ncbi:unnamed protein product [Amoebophrya sp. A120]|nr:unnamed protein product [Amoebophrya sp. A120]|eukprot:GSA120T00007845001.1
MKQPVVHIGVAIAGVHGVLVQQGLQNQNSHTITLHQHAFQQQQQQQGTTRAASRDQHGRQFQFPGGSTPAGNVATTYGAYAGGATMPVGGPQPPITPPDIYPQLTAGLPAGSVPQPPPSRPEQQVLAQKGTEDLVATLSQPKMDDTGNLMYFAAVNSAGPLSNPDNVKKAAEANEKLLARSLGTSGGNGTADIGGFTSAIKKATAGVMAQYQKMVAQKASTDKALADMTKSLKEMVDCEEKTVEDATALNPAAAQTFPTPQQQTPPPPLPSGMTPLDAASAKAAAATGGATAPSTGNAALVQHRRDEAASPGIELSLSETGRRMTDGQMSMRKKKKKNDSHENNLQKNYKKNPFGVAPSLDAEEQDWSGPDEDSTTTESDYSEDFLEHQRDQNAAEEGQGADAESEASTEGAASESTVADQTTSTESSSQQTASSCEYEEAEVGYCREQELGFDENQFSLSQQSASSQQKHKSKKTAQEEFQQAMVSPDFARCSYSDTVQDCKKLCDKTTGCKALDHSAESAVCCLYKTGLVRGNRSLDKQVSCTRKINGNCKIDEKKAAVASEKKQESRKGVKKTKAANAGKGRKKKDDLKLNAKKQKEQAAKKKKKPHPVLWNRWEDTLLGREYPVVRPTLNVLQTGEDLLSPAEAAAAMLDRPIEPMPQRTDYYPSMQGDFLAGAHPTLFPSHLHRQEAKQDASTKSAEKDDAEQTSGAIERLKAEARAKEHQLEEQMHSLEAEREESQRIQNEQKRELAEAQNAVEELHRQNVELQQGATSRTRAPMSTTSVSSPSKLTSMSLVEKSRAEMMTSTSALQSAREGLTYDNTNEQMFLQQASAMMRTAGKYTLVEKSSVISKEQCDIPVDNRATCLEDVMFDAHTLRKEVRLSTAPHGCNWFRSKSSKKHGPIVFWNDFNPDAQELEVTAKESHPMMQMHGGPVCVNNEDRRKSSDLSRFNTPRSSEDLNGRKMNGGQINQAYSNDLYQMTSNPAGSTSNALYRDEQIDPRSTANQNMQMLQMQDQQQQGLLENPQQGQLLQGGVVAAPGQELQQATSFTGSAPPGAGSQDGSSFFGSTEQTAAFQRPSEQLVQQAAPDGRLTTQEQFVGQGQEMMQTFEQEPSQMMIMQQQQQQQLQPGQVMMQQVPIVQQQPQGIIYPM